MRLHFEKLRRSRCGDIGEHPPHIWTYKLFDRALSERRFCAGWGF